MNDYERAQWVDNDEGLYERWHRSGQLKSAWIRAHRALIDEVAENVRTGRRSQHYLKYGDRRVRGPRVGARHVPKTEVTYVVQGYYEPLYGWEDVTAEETHAEARQRLREYRENERQYPHRLIRRRVPRGAARRRNEFTRDLPAYNPGGRLRARRRRSQPRGILAKITRRRRR